MSALDSARSNRAAGGVGYVLVMKNFTAPYIAVGRWRSPVTTG